MDVKEEINGEIPYESPEKFPPAPENGENSGEISKNEDEDFLLKEIIPKYNVYGRKRGRKPEQKIQVKDEMKFNEESENPRNQGCEGVREEKEDVELGDADEEGNPRSRVCKGVKEENENVESGDVDEEGNPSNRVCKVSPESENLCEKDEEAGMEGRRKRRKVVVNYVGDEEEEEEDEDWKKKSNRRGPKKKRGRKPGAKVVEKGDEGDGKEEKSRQGRGRGKGKKVVEKATPVVCESVIENEEGHVGTERPKRGCRNTGVSKEVKKSKSKDLAYAYDENGVKIDSDMCHQCQRNDKGRVVRCTKCKTKRFCIPCIDNWYPRMKEEEIAQECPVCLGNCNCKACLRMEGAPSRLNSGTKNHLD